MCALCSGSPTLAAYDGEKRQRSLAMVSLKRVWLSPLGPGREWTQPWLSLSSWGCTHTGRAVWSRCISRACLQGPWAFDLLNMWSKGGVFPQLCIPPLLPPKAAQEDPAPDSSCFALPPPEVFATVLSAPHQFYSLPWVNIATSAFPPLFPESLPAEAREAPLPQN